MLLVGLAHLARGEVVVGRDDPQIVLAGDDRAVGAVGHGSPQRGDEFHIGLRRHQIEGEADKPFWRE